MVNIPSRNTKRRTRNTRSTIIRKRIKSTQPSLANRNQRTVLVPILVTVPSPRTFRPATRVCTVLNYKLAPNHTKLRYRTVRYLSLHPPTIPVQLLTLRIR